MIVKKIKNIIFDVGDVLLEYRWKDMLMDYGLSKEEAVKVGNLMFDNKLWSVLDLGTMSDEEVISEYARLYPEYATVMEWFIKNGEYMHVARPKVWERVHKLKTMGYGIYILSNYSRNLFEKHTKGASFLEDADGMVVSYQIHIAKPDKKIYEYLLNKYNLIAQECIFFDDRPDNTKAARQMGIEAVTVTGQDFLISELDKIVKSE